MKYKPKEYWEKRLTEQFNLTGVGHIGFNENYNNYLYELKKDTLNLILKKYHISMKGKNVLDIGSGTGFFIDFYSNLGPKSITGIDITEQSVKKLKEIYPNYMFKCLDISSNNIPLNNKYDVVNVFDVLYHIINYEKFESAIANLGKLSKDGAHIFITDVFGSNEITPADHVCFRRYNLYEELLKQNDIEIFDIQQMYHLMNKNFKYVPISVLNRLARLFFKIGKTLNRCSVKTKDIKLLICRKVVR